MRKKAHGLKYIDMCIYIYIYIYIYMEEGRKRLKNLPRNENQQNGDYDYFGKEEKKI